LYEKHQTVVGPGHWFERDDRYMRIGFGFPKTDELRTGLAHLENALKETAK
jgi:DNA-binding transcriptional MocR family regulator